MNRLLIRNEEMTFDYIKKFFVKERTCQDNKGESGKDIRKRKV